MKATAKRIISYLLVMAMLAGFCPGYAKEARAATSSVTLANLGSLGSMTAGSKTKSGSWWMMKVGGKKAFCMNLGYTCHTGDAYQNASATYSSSDSGKKGLKAYIGYWYAETMKQSRKAYVMAQALFWAVEEGDTSEADLKAVISKIKSNTGYFGSKSANTLYTEIFEKSGTFSVKTIEWKYSGSGSHRQELLVIDAGNQAEPQSVTLDDYYRQRIKIHKVDEDGNPMAGVKFTIQSGNIDELYSYKANGSQTDADEDISNFSIQAETDSSGWINLRLTYRLQTNDYFYLDADDLKDMDADAKKKLKEEWDEMGYHYAPDLTGEGASSLMEQELVKQLNEIKNTYSITETDSGNKNITVNPDYKNGKNVVVGKENSWTRFVQLGEQLDWGKVLEKPYELEITDHYKKAALSIKKSDGYSKDKKAHGDATLDGAEFGVYTDRQCTKPAVFFKKDGSLDYNNVVSTKNGQAETGYLRCGQAYYIKELRAPEGYILNTDLKEVTLDGGKYPDDVEYAPTQETVSVEEAPILGKVAIQKFYSDGQTGQIHPEVGAEFQVYLDSEGSYDNCNEYERDILTIDEKGYACTKELYYGIYRIHQISSGDKDTEKVEDIYPVSIDNPDKVEIKDFYMNNNLFKAYLRIIKKDGNTKKDVLKAGTIYQIYKVADGKETLVTQEYSNGNKKVTVDRFVTDETGQIMTYQALASGTYRIYETDAAAGYHISTPYIEVEINSGAGNYITEADKDGNTYSTVELEYTNQEAFGKLSLKKTGEQLAGYEEGQFIYKEKPLNGAVFEIYADDDVETQDNQGTYWFEKGDLAGTITTGEGAVFESECGGLTGYEMDQDGVVTVNLPLGRYRITEKETPYGYILPEKDWKVEFNWENKDTEVVLNATDVTDGTGTLHVKNQRAVPQVRLVKTDRETKTGVPGAVFGLYTKDAIYNADGEKIVEAGTLLETLATDREGKALCSVDLPLMSEGYRQQEGDGSSSGSAISSAGSGGEEEPDPLNSGDYYLKEQEVSGSYYLEGTEYPVHLEYMDQETKTIEAEVKAENTQTEAVVSKTSITNSEELAGCGLQITDAEGHVIVGWTSGDKDSIWLNEKLEEMGYCNVSAALDERGSLQAKGLFHDSTYTLTETRPADGYVTADSISFRLVQGENGQTLVALVNGENMTLQANNIVHMVDDTTKVEISKTEIAGSGEIPGCELEITDKDSGTVMDAWTSTEEKHIIEQKLIAGRTYILTEKRPADGYATADSIEFTIQDTGEIQGVQMKDDTTKIRFEKKNEAGDRIGGARIRVYDSRGKRVAAFTTKKGKAVKLDGILKVDETYTFKEVKAPEGYEKAEPARYKVRDTGKKQTVSMVDKKIGEIRTKTPDDFHEGSDSGTSPQTGFMELLAGLLSLAMAGGGASLFAWRRYFTGLHGCSSIWR